MKYHLCCNQLEYCWEIRDKNEEVIFKGNYKEVEKEFERYNKGKEKKIKEYNENLLLKKGFNIKI